MCKKGKRCVSSLSKAKRDSYFAEKAKELGVSQEEARAQHDKQYELQRKINDPKVKEDPEKREKLKRKYKQEDAPAKASKEAPKAKATEAKPAPVVKEADLGRKLPTGKEIKQARAAFATAAARYGGAKGMQLSFKEAFKKADEEFQELRLDDSRNRGSRSIKENDAMKARLRAQEDLVNRLGLSDPYSYERHYVAREAGMGREPARKGVPGAKEKVALFESRKRVLDKMTLEETLNGFENKGRFPNYGYYYNSQPLRLQELASKAEKVKLSRREEVEYKMLSSDSAVKERVKK